MPKMNRSKPRRNPFATRFSRALADLESQGISQAMVAADLGCSENTITSWKLGHHQPRLKSLEAVAKALDIPLEEFLSTEASAVAKAAAPTPEKLIGELARLDLLGALEALTEQEPSFQQLARRSDDLIALLKEAQRIAGN